MKNQLKKEEAVDICTFTVYLQIGSTEMSSELKQPGKDASTTMTMTSNTKGPFKFDTSHSFTAFQHEVAHVLFYHKALLPILEFKWKLKKESSSMKEDC